MSLEIVAKLICDNCRAEIVGKMCSRSTRSGESYWDANRTAEKNGWLTVSRGRYRIPAHYCKDCADKPVAKLKDPPRTPKCKRCKAAEVFRLIRARRKYFGSSAICAQSATALGNRLNDPTQNTRTSQECEATMKTLPPCDHDECPPNRCTKTASNSPKTAEPHWAKGVGENADMGWQLFIVEVNERTGKLVVRFANALHTEFAKTHKSIEPWFTPSPDRWAKWTVAEKPK